MLSQRRAGRTNRTEERKRSWSVGADKGLGEGAARQERERDGRLREECRRQRGQRAGWAAGGGWEKRGAFHYDSSPSTMPPSPPQQPSLSPRPERREQGRDGRLPWVRVPPHGEHGTESGAGGGVKMSPGSKRGYGKQNDGKGTNWISSPPPPPPPPKNSCWCQWRKSEAVEMTVLNSWNTGINSRRGFGERID